MDAAPHGLVEQAGPGVRRVLARNPSPFTFTGTQTHIVGTGEVAVIDPGPDLPEHIDAILAATAGERIAVILVTHSHRDHSPGAPVLAAASGAPVVGCAALHAAAAGPEEGFDTAYAPDRVLADREAVSGPGWTLRALATPGHTSNHLCFAFEEGLALFSGDHVMGWSTSVVFPPDGDMGDYMASLALLIGRGESVYYPGHGEPIGNPAGLVRGMLAHRRAREAQIVRLLEPAAAPVSGLVDRMYAGLDPRLSMAAAGSVLAHLLDLERRGRVVRADDCWRAT